MFGAADNESAFVARMIVKSLMVRHVLCDCGDRRRAWAHNARASWFVHGHVDFLLGRRGLYWHPARIHRNARAESAQSYSRL